MSGKSKGKTKAGKERQRPAMPGAGRPTSLNERVIAKIAGLIHEHSVSQYDAANLTGVTSSTMKLWLKSGKQTRKKVEDGATKKSLTHFERMTLMLLEKVELAKSDDKKTYLSKLKERALNDHPMAAGSSVAALKFMLSKRWPAEYGDRSEVDHNVRMRPTIDPSKLTEEELETMLTLRAKASVD